MLDAVSLCFAGSCSEPVQGRCSAAWPRWNAKCGAGSACQLTAATAGHRSSPCQRSRGLLGRLGTLGRLSGRRSGVPGPLGGDGGAPGSLPLPAAAAAQAAVQFPMRLHKSAESQLEMYADQASLDITQQRAVTPAPICCHRLCCAQPGTCGDAPCPGMQRCSPLDWRWGSAHNSKGEWNTTRVAGRMQPRRATAGR